MSILHGDFNVHYPILVKGEGAYVFDEQGNRYLDAIGGVIPEGAEVECSADTLYLYSADITTVLANLPVNHDRTVLHRRASLEDVFLRLTGRDLRE